MTGWLNNNNNIMNIFTFLYTLIIDGNLGCFHVLDIINNSEMNIGVYVSFPISDFSFFKYPQVQFLGDR